MHADHPNKMALGDEIAEGQTPTTGENLSIPQPPVESSVPPMHAPIPVETAKARSAAMQATLNQVDAADKREILNALRRGFARIGQGRSEDALKAAGYTWPDGAVPRCLGPLVASLARRGVIEEIGQTKGLTQRSHAGIVRWWQWRGEGASHG